MAIASSNPTLQRVADAFADLLLKHRILWLAIVALITVWLGYEGSKLQLSPGFDKSVPLSHPYMENTFLKYRQEFGGANRITVFVENQDGDIFEPEFLSVLERVTGELLVMPGVDARTVTSLYTPNVNYVAVSELGFTGSRIVPADFQPTREAIDEVRSNLAKSSEIGRTVANDLSGALVVAEIIERDPVTGKVLDYSEVFKRLQNLRNTYETDDIKLRVTGFAPFIGEMIRGAGDIVTFFGITLVVTLFLLMFFAGSSKLAVASTLTALVAVVWQLGMVHFLGYGIDPLSVLVPFLILAIGVSHAVQMTNLWRTNVAFGKSPHDAAHAAVGMLLIPGATALIADAVGFAVIVVIDIPIIHELAITASIGVGVMLVTNKIMLPILLSYVRLSEREVAKARTAAEGSRTRLWNFLTGFTMQPGAGVAMAVGGVMLVAGVVAGHSVIVGDNEPGAPEFWPESRYNIDARTISEKFSVGLDEVVVIARSDKPEACVEYSVMKPIDDLVWQMQSVPGVRSVTSLSQVVRERNIGNFEANPKFLGLPRDPQMISANMYRVEASQGLFSNDCQRMPIYINTVDHQAATLKRVTDTVERFSREFPSDEVTFELAMGNGGIMAATNEVVSQAQGFMLVILFVAIAIFCYLTFLSWRATVCAVVPLVVVAYFAHVIMIWLDIGLKVSTLPVIALGVAVGVDYAIYLLARTLAHLRDEQMTLPQAYFKALTEVGSAVVMTAITMTIGVATWAFSHLKFQADMGVLLAYMFFVNMLGAVILTPAAAYWLLGGKKDRAAEQKVAYAS